MKKIVAELFISLDGVVDAPQTWHFPYYNDEMAEVVGSQIADADTIVLGRRTYEEWASSWPNRAVSSSSPTRSIALPSSWRPRRSCPSTGGIRR